MPVARQALAAARALARRQGHQPGSTGERTARRSGAREPGSGRPRPGGPSSYSSAGPDERDPALLSAHVQRLTEERGWHVELAVGAVVGRWPEIVGAELAAHARPETFEGGELVLVADSTAWATQLRLLAPVLLRQLEAELGAGVVRQIRVRGPVAPSWKRGPRSVPGRGPRDTYG